MKILMLRNYKEYRTGERYDVDDWTGQQMVELKKAITVKDLRDEDTVAKARSVRPRKPTEDRPL